MFHETTKINLSYTIDRKYKVFYSYESTVNWIQPIRKVAKF